ncbi:MAG: peptide-methionine (S)-S-oxide reductase MsrA [Rubripirellula sp.]|nr:peptide-methionine (S)-S-oxide reductase MsrA [Rubripirellula sp.]
MTRFMQRSMGFMAIALLVFWALPNTAEDSKTETLGQSTRAADTTDQLATFAGGCFWCMEPAFDKLDGVISTTSGYTGGRTKNPTYEQVTTGKTGHIESMQVRFDPSRVSYEELVWLFWHNVDPTQVNGQFCDKGNQYRTVIFVHNQDQQQIAQSTQKRVGDELGKRIATQIVAAGRFYPAEDYHQDYYRKNPTKYKFYRWNCGRDARLKVVWGQKAGQP